MPIRVSGVERWERKLGRLFPYVQARLRKTIGQEAESLAESLYRVLGPGGIHDEGDLQKSVDYYEVRGSGDLRWRVAEGDDVAFYARMVEFGTPRQRAQPHFYPMYRAHRKRIRNRMARAVRLGIRDGMRS